MVCSTPYEQIWISSIDKTGIPCPGNRFSQPLQEQLRMSLVVA